MRGSTYHRTCVDQAFVPPSGVHVSLWRYIETSASDCTSLATSTTAILGYVATGVDRVRREYNAAGRLLDVVDAAGNRVDYTYNGRSQLTAVTERIGGGGDEVE